MLGDYFSEDCIEKSNAFEKTLLFRWTSSWEIAIICSDAIYLEFVICIHATLLKLTYWISYVSFNKQIFANDLNVCLNSCPQSTSYSLFMLLIALLCMLNTHH